MVKSLIISNFVVLKNKTHTNMLRDKGTKNLSELKNFFTTGEKAFFAIYNTLRSLKIDFKYFGFKKANNEKISAKMKLFLLIFFPFFSINNPTNYCKSNIYKLFSFQKGYILSLTQEPKYSLERTRTLYNA